MLLDHLAVAGETLDAAAAHVEAALGVPMQPGGRHARFGTHNRLLGLEGGLYLEAIATDPAAPPPGTPRWFDLDRFSGPPRLSNWICRVDDLDAALDAMPGAGIAHDVARGALEWRMAVPADGILPMDGAHPALIQWQSAPTPGETLAPSGCRLLRLEISHPFAGELAEFVAGSLIDERVVITAGPAGLQAEFDTPQGRRMLR